MNRSLRKTVKMRAKTEFKSVDHVSVLGDICRVGTEKRLVLGQVLRVCEVKLKKSSKNSGLWKYFLCLVQTVRLHFMIRSTANGKY